MNKFLTAIALIACVGLSHAGLPEVIAAEQAAAQAKEKVKAAKKGLTKVEKAELAVATADEKLAKAKAPKSEK